jgi:hypothetical protein
MADSTTLEICVAPGFDMVALLGERDVWLRIIEERFAADFVGRVYAAFV